MLITSKKFKALASQVKNALNFSTISDMLSPVITDESIKSHIELIKKSKGQKTLKNNVANEFVAKNIGYKDYNTALATIEKAENLSKYEIFDKLNKLLEDLNDNRHFVHKNVLNIIKGNISDLKEEELLKNLLKTDDSNLNECNINLKNYLLWILNNEIKDIYVDSYTEDHVVYEFEIKIYYENNYIICIDGECNSELKTIEKNKTTINGNYLNDVEHDLLNNLHDVISNVFQVSTSSNFNYKNIDDEKLKELSIFLSSLEPKN